MALEPLATAADLAARLKIAVPDDDLVLAQMETHLVDASGELRSAIGQPITRMTSTAELWPERAGFYDIPAWPIVEIAEVKLEGEAAAWKRVGPNRISVPRACGPVEVTFTHGWEPIPEDIVKWTCVLAASSLAAAEQTESLGLVAGISQRSEKIDDYQLSWQTPEAGGGDSASGMTLPIRIAEKLRAQYGGGSIFWLEVQG